RGHRTGARRPAGAGEAPAPVSRPRVSRPADAPTVRGSARLEQRVQLAQVERLDEELETEGLDALTRGLARVAGDDDDPDRGVELLDVADRLEAVEARHGEVEQHEGGSV